MHNTKPFFIIVYIWKFTMEMLGACPIYNFHLLLPAHRTQPFDRQQPVSEAFWISECSPHFCSHFLHKGWWRSAGCAVGGRWHRDSCIVLEPTYFSEMKFSDSGSVHIFGLRLPYRQLSKEFWSRFQYQHSHLVFPHVCLYWPRFPMAARWSSKTKL